MAAQCAKNETEMTKPGPKSQEICRKYWVKNAGDGCCVGCPIQIPCGTWCPTTIEAIEKHNETVENAAIKYFETQNIPD